MNRGQTQPAEDSRPYAIGDLIVDPGRRLVLRGDDELVLPRLSFQLLTTLAESAPNVLTSDELIARVWNGRIVSPETITQRVKLLRRALGDDAGEPRYIAAVRGEGYRLLMPVSEIGTATPDTQASRRHNVLPAAALLIVVVIALALLVQTTPESQTLPQRADVVALLPLTTPDHDLDVRQLSNGLSDELRETLRNFGLQMVARTSSRAYLDTAMLATHIAEELGAGTLIEGSVRRQDDGVLVSLAIVDGFTGIERWSNAYRLRSTNLPDTHRRIAVDVIAELVPGADTTAIAPATGDPTAYGLMLLARHFELKDRDQPVVDVDALDRAIELYRQVAESDPGSAIAQSRLAAALLQRGDIAAAEPHALRAVELDPDHADVQYTLGLMQWFQNGDGAGDAYRRAVDLDPNHADAISAYGKWVWHQPTWSDARPLLQRALALDSMSLSRYADLGVYLGIIGDRRATLALIDEIDERFHSPAAYELIAHLYELLGELDEAIAWALKGRAAAPADLPDPTWQLSELYSRIGDFATARRLLPEPDLSRLYLQRRYPELIDLAEELILENADAPRVYHFLAFAYNTQQQYAEAARLLRVAGLPESAYASSRRSHSLEAMMTLGDSLLGAGEIEAGTKVATFLRNHMQAVLENGGGASWWPNLLQSCALMQLGEEELALQRLETLAGAAALPWEPMVRDARCFVPLADEPRYLGVLARLEQRRAQLQARLPQTLRRHGLAPP